ncbi:MAG: putative regulatory protein, FmdB family [Candidatus Electronema aureum]|uniref:Regulatory protein, FmdB family n=1 Tax=Candidatus Electronema aureum TaxID=2005002 RepID=A0A521G3M5_9BACT|nr:MAG: putative regulatory protein, FmdB family [Candidatus Electronema aureum]
MPVYEYKCSTCERVFELQQKISDPPLTICSECGSTVKKLVSASAFHLKGGGWYADGYSSGSSKEAGSSESKTLPVACAGDCKTCPASS